jgi:soluble lytic murein transglycosylase
MGLYRTAIITSRHILDLANLNDASTLKAPAYFNHISFWRLFQRRSMRAAQNEHPSIVLFQRLRQESMFEGFVESSAGARGIMQSCQQPG